jgi:hypothetical protein
VWPFFTPWPQTGQSRRRGLLKSQIRLATMKPMNQIRTSNMTSIAVQAAQEDA